MVFNSNLSKKATPFCWLKDNRIIGVPLYLNLNRFQLNNNQNKFTVVSKA